MLAGFLKPTAGEIKLNEQSLTSLTDENYRQSVQFIPQKTYIFAGTFRENLAFTNLILLMTKSKQQQNLLV